MSELSIVYFKKVYFNVAAERRPGTSMVPAQAATDDVPDRFKTSVARVFTANYAVHIATNRRRVLGSHAPVHGQRCWVRSSRMAGRFYWELAVVKELCRRRSATKDRQECRSLRRGRYGGVI